MTLQVEAMISKPVMHLRALLRQSGRPSPPGLLPCVTSMALFPRFRQVDTRHGSPVPHAPKAHRLRYVGGSELPFSVYLLKVSGLLSIGRAGASTISSASSPSVSHDSAEDRSEKYLIFGYGVSRLICILPSASG